MTDDPRSYTTGALRPGKVERLWLGLTLSAVAACVSVTLVSLTISFFLFLVVDAFGLEAAFDMGGGAYSGVTYALILGIFNFLIFFINVPVTLLTMYFTIGRLARRRVASMRPYLIWASALGSMLVGVTTGVLGSFGAGLGQLAGAALTGLLIGALAGLFCGFLFYKIVRPQEQAFDRSADVF